MNGPNRPSRAFLRELGLLRRARLIWRGFLGVLMRPRWSRSLGGLEPSLRRRVPPPALCHLCSDSYDPRQFISSGFEGAVSISETLASAGRPLEGFRNIMDFGCGCCRIMGNLLSGLSKAGITVADSDHRMLEWVRRNLPGLRVVKSVPGQPLDLEPEQFDLVMAVAVLPWMNREDQIHAITELRRILMPEGLLYLTLKGESRIHEMSPGERSLFCAGSLVVREPDFSGSNYCIAYDPDQFVREVLLPGFAVLNMEPAGSRDTRQDVWLLLKE